MDASLNDGEYFFVCYVCIAIACNFTLLAYVYMCGTCAKGFLRQLERTLAVDQGPLIKKAAGLECFFPLPYLSGGSDVLARLAAVASLCLS